MSLATYLVESEGSDQILLTSDKEGVGESSYVPSGV